MNTVDKEGSKFLSEMIIKNRFLKNLNLNYNNLDIGSSFIIDSLDSNESLEDLSLSYVGLNLDSIQKLFENLKTNKSLKRIDISYNLIEETTYNSKLFDFLSFNNTIEEQSLDGIGIKNYFPSLCRTLQNQNSIKILSLSANDLDDQGITLFSDSLKINKKLQEINLSYNSITNRGANFVLKALNDNKTLLKINLEYNQINSTIITKINTVLECNIEWSSLSPKLFFGFF